VTATAAALIKRPDLGTIAPGPPPTHRGRFDASASAAAVRSTPRTDRAGEPPNIDQVVVDGRVLIDPAATFTATSGDHFGGNGRDRQDLGLPEAQALQWLTVRRCSNATPVKLRKTHARHQCCRPRWADPEAIARRVVERMIALMDQAKARGPT